MIKIELLQAKARIEEEVRATRLWLIHKEDLEYSNFISNPLNEKMLKSAKDKIISQLKIEDEIWIQKEMDLDSQEMALKIINIGYETLQNTLRALGNPNSGINNEMFQAIQELYLKELRI